MIQQSRPAGDRVWLVMADNTGPDGKSDQATEMLRELYGNGRRLVDAQKFSDITILLFARDAALVTQATEKGR